MAERLEIKILDANGTPAQYEKVVVAYKTKSGGIEEKTFTSSADGHIKTGIKISKLHRNTFFYFDGGQGHPKVLGQDTQLVGQTHQFKVSSKNPLNFLVLYEYFDQDGANQSITIPDLSYKVFNKGKVIKIGKTDKNGMTSAFKAIKSQGYQIQIKPKHSSTYIIPIIRKKYQDSQSPTVKYDGTTLYAICLETYVGFKVVNNKNKGIPNVKVWLVDKNGKQQGDTRTTDKNGRIKPFVQNFSRTVKVSLKGCELTLKEKEVVIPKHQGEDPYHIIEVKTRTCSTGLNKPNHEATLAANTKLPFIFDLEKREIVIFETKDYNNLINNLSKIDKYMKDVHNYREKMATALKNGDLATVTNTEQPLKEAQKTIRAVINKDFNKKEHLKEILIVKTGANSNTSIKNARLERKYIKRVVYEDLYGTRINKSEEESSIPTPTHSKSETNDSMTSFSQMDSLENFKPGSLEGKISNIKHKLEKKGTVKNHWDLDVLDFLLPAANEIEKNLLQSESYSVDAEAQWLRGIGSASADASGTWDAGKNVGLLDDKIGLHGGLNASGKLVLCEAKVAAKCAYPSLKGFNLKVNYGDGIIADFGALRVLLSLEITGMVGARLGVVGEANLKIDLNDQQVISAVNGNTQDTIRSIWDANNNMPALELDYAGLPSNDNDRALRDAQIKEYAEMHNLTGQVGVDAFVGVEVGAKPTGGLEWLNPKVKNFRTLAKVSAEIAVSYGAGFSLDFYVFFDFGRGKIKIRAKVKGCVGLGGKLGLEYEVTMGVIAEFALWVFYQLVDVGFKKLLHISGPAFKALTQYSAIYLGSDSNVTIRLESIRNDFDNFERNLNTDKQRYLLANEIMNDRKADLLLHSTPNAKGILLYHLSRHQWFSSGYDWPTFSLEDSNYSTIRDVIKGIRVNLLDTRKQAIHTIFATVTTHAEWDNILQHMTNNGDKSDRYENEAHILRFLSYGINNQTNKSLIEILNDIKSKKFNRPHDTDNKNIDKYLDKYASLIDGFYPKGEAIVKNTAPAFEKMYVLAKNNYVNPNFCSALDPEQYDPNSFDIRDMLDMQKALERYSNK
ncbi:MAG: hypothetical protein ACTHWC_03215 [Psychrobacter sp.]